MSKAGGGLANARVIGGAVVEIKGDLSGLRAAESEARAIATRIGSMVAALPAGMSGTAVAGPGGGVAAMPSGTGMGAAGSAQAAAAMNSFVAKQAYVGQATGFVGGGSAAAVPNAAVAAGPNMAAATMNNFVASQFARAASPGASVAGWPSGTAAWGSPVSAAPAATTGTTYAVRQVNGWGVGTGQQGFGVSSYAAAASSRTSGAGMAIDPEWDKYHKIQSLSKTTHEAKLQDMRIARERTEEDDEEEGPAGTRTGGKGGGKGSGGRGAVDLSRKNLLSARGISAGLGMSMTGVFAALAAVHVATGFADAADTESHPERILRAINEGSAHDANSDKYLKEQAGASASNQGSQMRLQAVEAVPIIGSLVALADAASGASAAMREQGKVIEANIVAHQKALTVIDQQNVRAAELSGDPETVVRTQLRQQEAELVNAANAHPEDRAARDALYVFRQNAADTIARAHEKSEATLPVLDMRAKEMYDRGAGRAASADSRLAAANVESPDTVRGFDRTAMEMKQRAERGALARTYEEDQAGADPWTKYKLQRQYRQDVRKMDQDHAAEQQEFLARGIVEQRTIANDTRLAVASGQSATLRMGKEYYAADKRDRDAAFANSISAVADPNQRAIMGSAHEAQEKQLRAVESERRRDTLGGYELSTTIDRYAIQNKTQEAKATQDVYRIQQDIAKAQPYAKAAAYRAGIAAIERSSYELNPLQGGDFAVDASPQQIVNDPYDLSGRARDTQRGQALLKDTERKAKAGQAAWGNPLFDPVKGMMGKDGKWSNNAVGNGDGTTPVADAAPAGWHADVLTKLDNIANSAGLA